MQKAHHPKGASNCERWTECLGAEDMISRAPEEKPSFYAAEGTVAHAIASARLEGQGYPKVGHKFEADGFEIEFTLEMLEAIEVYVQFCEELADKYVGSKIHVETRVSIPDVDHGEDLFGTADFIAVVPFRRLVVVDYKHGAGVKVNAYKNKQLKYYGLGALLALHPWIAETIPVVELVIVQPRGIGEAISRYETTPQELIEFHAFLKERAALVVPGAPLKAGDWCKFCPAKAMCPAQLELHQKNALADFRDYKIEPTPPVAVPREVLINILNNSENMEAWLKSCWTYAETMAESDPDWKAFLGEHGYKIVEGRKGATQWTDAKAAEAYLIEQKIHTLTNIKTEPKLLTPTQIKDSIKSLNSERKRTQQDVITLDLNVITTQSPGKAKLAKVNDERPELPPKAIRDFQQYTVIDV